MRSNPDESATPASNQANLESAALNLVSDPAWIASIALETRQRASVRGASLSLLVAPLGLYAICVYLIGSGRARLVDALLPASGVALALAVVALFIYGASRLFRKRAVSGALTSVTVASLLLTAGGGLLSLRPAHMAQARAYEQRGAWSAAIAEYALTGEHGSAAQDIPRVHDEWGEALLKQDQYGAALEQFAVVTALYASSGAAAARARKDTLETYNAWLQTGADGMPYADAITFFQAYRQMDECDSTCQRQLNALEPHAIYLYGQTLLSQENYDGAYSQFVYIQLHFSSNNYAHVAYLGAAKAEYAKGKSLLTNENPYTCEQAIMTYQVLILNYANTPQAASAKAALHVPQTVSGVFKGFPTNPTPQVYLSRKAHAPAVYNAPPGSFYFSNDYRTSIDARTGKFTFRNVIPGTYALTTYRSTATGGWAEWFSFTPNVLSQQVVPLCPTNLGTFDDSAQK